ncbi:hypothetical protein ABPG72_000289 [Tetrahymena utriculariae]
MFSQQQNGYQVFPDQQISTRNKNKWIYSTNIGGDTVISFVSQVSGEIYFARVSYINNRSLQIFENFFQRTIEDLSEGYEYKLKQIKEQNNNQYFVQRSIRQFSNITLNIGSNDFGEHSVANKVIESICRLESNNSCPFKFQIETISPSQTDCLYFSFEGILQTNFEYAPQNNFQESYYEYQ